MAERSLIAVVTPAFGSAESVAALAREVDGTPTEVRLVAPAVCPNTLHHAMGDVDVPRVHAAKRLEDALAAARALGLQATGEVGDSDPVRAAQDALLEKPAEEVLLFCHDDDCKEWYESGLWKHAEEELAPLLKLVVVDRGDHVVKTEEAPPGHLSASDGSAGNAYLPGVSRADMAVMVLGVLGTIVAIVLAAAAATGGTATGWRAGAIGVAIAVALVNMSNVVGTLLMDSVSYHGGFAKMFRDLALVGTPVAVLVNLAILIFG
ncbi:MAG TPA: hypothetical protein VHA80_03150 [Solirubrobacterales bacterium]|jgi:hypothetical protein|nr:hypothetical protein [Solirubrobacterales bacterium]